MLSLCLCLPSEYDTCQVMEEDMAQPGYIMEYTKVDTQRFLLRQRRNRVYATADVSTGQCQQDYAAKMRATLASLESDMTCPSSHWRMREC